MNVFYYIYKEMNVFFIKGESGDAVYQADNYYHSHWVSSSPIASDV